MRVYLELTAADSQYSSTGDVLSGVRLYYVRDADADPGDRAWYRRMNQYLCVADILSAAITKGSVVSEWRVWRNPAALPPRG